MSIAQPSLSPMIHPSAVVDPAAEIADDVVIGPGCVIVGPVRLAAGVQLMANVFLQGPLTVGERTRFWPGAVVGCDPQDYKVKPGFPTAGVTIGADCLIREGATVHAASKTDVPTRIGDRVFMMVNTHAGHDAQVGNDVVMVNGTVLAGHTQVGDKVTISGNTGVHQFCRIGRFAFISGLSAVAADVLPFCVHYSRNTLAGVNLVGMRRNGFSRDDVTMVRKAFREIIRRNLPRQGMIQALETLARESATPCAPVLEMAEFARNAKRTLCPYRPLPGRGEAEDLEG